MSMHSLPHQHVGQHRLARRKYSHCLTPFRGTILKNCSSSTWTCPRVQENSKCLCSHLAPESCKPVGKAELSPIQTEGAAGLQPFVHYGSRQLAVTSILQILLQCECSHNQGTEMAASRGRKGCEWSPTANCNPLWLTAVLPAHTA